MKKIIAAALLLTVSACTDAENAERVLKSNGMQKVEITGYRWLSCGEKSDFYRTGFEAISASGDRVSGTVCAGLIFKGSTIRFD